MDKPSKNSGLGADFDINTEEPVKNDGVKRLPHERDESPDAQTITPRDVMRQAASDLEQGLVDTDLHGERGVEKVHPAEPRQAKPIAAPDAAPAPKKPQ
ncbi:MAG: hypothetical protein H7Z39_14840 [Burkholderiaceae bacterium]|nr:hypothetical protein [Burkholderiaceae bacterium]